MEEIINLGMAFFFSGSETSYVPLSNTLYELAMNPGVQQKLFEELQEAFAGKSELDYETLQNLPYLDKVIKGKIWGREFLSLRGRRTNVGYIKETDFAAIQGDSEGNSFIKLK